MLVVVWKQKELTGKTKWQASHWSNNDTPDVRERGKTYVSQYHQNEGGLLALYPEQPMAQARPEILRLAAAGLLQPL